MIAPDRRFRRRGAFRGEAPLGADGSATAAPLLCVAPIAMASSGVVGYSLLFSLVPVLVAYLVLLVAERRTGRGLSMPRSALPVVMVLGGVGGAIFGAMVAPGYRSRLDALQDPELAELLATALVTPLAEELGKALVLFPLFLFHRVRTTLDGLVLGLAAGAGFAAIENLLVAIRTFAESGTEAWMASVRIRMGYGTAIHATSSALLGACLGKAQADGRLRWMLIAPTLGLLAAVTVHGAWNALLLLGSRGAPAWLHLARLETLGGALFVALLLFRASARDSEVQQVP